MSATACTVAPHVNARPLASYTLPLNTDCLINLPKDESSNQLLVGCYQLDESTRSKDGSINKFRINQSSNQQTAQINNRSINSFDLIDSFQTSAIFDIARVDDQYSLAVDSVGLLHLIDQSNEKLIELSTLSVDNDCLCYVDYRSGLAAIGGSNGNVSVVQIDTSAAHVTQTFKQAHYDSVWCTLIDQSNNLIYSGSDDCVVKANDIRSGDSRTINQSTHQAGICHLALHPSDSNLIASGSYDERFRIFDIRNWRAPIHETRLGGGVWRLDWRDEDTVAAACMHNGAHVLKRTDDQWTVKSSYYGHESLVYGILFIDDHTLASCSFYDKSLQLWAFDD